MTVSMTIDYMCAKQVRWYDFVLLPMTNESNQNPAAPPHLNYQPRPWERIVSSAAAITVVGLIGFLVIRNQPFSDPNLVVLVRILLAFAMAVLGATVPGSLNVEWSGKGVGVRATGAVGLFVLTFFFTPTALVTQRLPASSAPVKAPPDEKTNKMVYGPVKIYFGSSYDPGGTSTPDYNVTNEVREAVQKNADWIASLDGSVESVVSSHIDEGVSAEVALALSENGGSLVRNLLAEDGVNR